MALGRKIVWFSCGAASAVAAKISAERYNDVEIAYCDTLPYEHKDNVRFLQEVSEWLGKDIKILSSDSYTDIYDVWNRTKFLVSPPPSRIALCTLRLKRDVRESYQRADDLHIFGFTADESQRISRFVESNPELDLEFPLNDLKMTKQDCLDFLNKSGIGLPMMYKLGYRNNNCIGCVKGTKGYWNKIRKDFPDAFSRMCEVEENTGARVFFDTPLNKLDPNIEMRESDFDVECGPFCSIPDTSLDADKLERTVSFLSENPGASVRELGRSGLGYKKSRAVFYRTEARKIIRSTKNNIV